jgi:hypothetical protein
MKTTNYTIQLDLENSRIVENYLRVCSPEEFEAANREVKELMFQNNIKDRVAEFSNSLGVYCSVSVSQENSLIQDTWNGSFGTQGHFLQVVNYVMERVKGHKLTKWLANLKDMVGVFDSSRDHLTNVVMPSVIRSGLKKEAIVLPKALSATLTTRDALQKVEKIGNLSVGHFADEDDARLWLVG